MVKTNFFGKLRLGKYFSFPAILYFFTECYHFMLLNTLQIPQELFSDPAKTKKMLKLL